MPADLIIVIATYNERQTLPDLVALIREHIADPVILVVDDNSPDGTGDWVRDQSADDPGIRLLHRQQKDGLGAATLAGLHSAMAEQPTWIATMDADLSHHPEDLARMWHEAGTDRYDVVIGSRYVRGGRIENWSWRRRLASRVVNGLVRWALWLKTRDNSGAFRLYRRSTLQNLELDRISCQGFVYLEQILVHLRRAGARFHEIPIVFRERQHGVSKVTFAELIRNLRDILWLAVKRR